MIYFLFCCRVAGQEPLPPLPTLPPPPINSCEAIFKRSDSVNATGELFTNIAESEPIPLDGCFIHLISDSAQEDVVNCELVISKTGSVKCLRTMHSKTGQYNSATLRYLKISKFLPGLSWDHTPIDAFSSIKIYFIRSKSAISSDPYDQYSVELLKSRERLLYGRESRKIAREKKRHERMDERVERKEHRKFSKINSITT